MSVVFIEICLPLLRKAGLPPAGTMIIFAAEAKQPGMGRPVNNKRLYIMYYVLKSSTSPEP